MNISRKWLTSAGVAGVLLAGGIYGGTALAQTSSTSASASPAASASASASARPDPQAMFQNYVAHLAQRLNLSTDAVTAALKNAQKDVVADDLKAGRITQAQADQIDQRIDSGRGGPGFGFGTAPGGPHGGPGGGPDGQAALNAAATALNMQPADLQTQLRSGKTLQDVATAQKVDIAKVEAAVTAAVKPQLDQAVSGGKLTSQQEQDILSQISSGKLPGRFGPRPNGAAPSGSARPSARPSASASA